MIILLICDYNGWCWKKSKKVSNNGLKKIYNHNNVIVYEVDNQTCPQRILGLFHNKQIKIFKAQKHDGKWINLQNYQVKQINSAILRNYRNNLRDNTNDKQIKNIINQLTKDPLIIILTEEVKDIKQNITGYPEWIESLKAKGCTFYNDKVKPLKNTVTQNNQGEIRIIEYKTNDYTVLFVKENGYEIEKGKKKNNGIDDLLDKILQHNNWKNIPEKYVAVHALASYVKNKSNFYTRVKYICDFHHVDTSPDKEFCNLMIEFIEEFSQNHISKAENIYEKLIDKIKELTIRPQVKIAEIKHRIMNLLIPISIDLQGLKESNFNEDYWNKIVESYKGKNLNILNEINNYIFANKKDVESVRNAINKIEVNEIKNKANEILTEMRKLFKSNKKAYKYNDVIKIIKLISCKGRLNKLKEILAKENPFDKWLESLSNKLDELIQLE